MICFKTSRSLIRTGKICFLLAFTLCAPTVVLAQNEEFQSFNGANTSECIRTQKFEPWAVGIGFGKNFPGKGFLRNSSGGALYQAGLRLRASDTRHFHFQYSRAEIQTTQLYIWDGHNIDMDLTVNQYHFFHGWHGNFGLTHRSWTFFEFGPAILDSNSSPEGLEAISLALSLNFGMLVPVGDHLDFELGATVLVNLIEPDFGDQWGIVSQIYAGLQLH